jgi:hypothetical protein
MAELISRIPEYSGKEKEWKTYSANPGVKVPVPERFDLMSVQQQPLFLWEVNYSTRSACEFQRMPMLSVG